MRFLPHSLRLVIIAALALPALRAQIPVTSAKPLDGPEVFRFAIMPDRTGGMRNGIFEDGIAKVQQLRPEFVMSVGDLIDGYTEDPKIWNAEWEEFEGILKQLTMPFYRVPGNHDISNRPLLDEWRRRHGAPYYSFNYKGVLFLVLHTEDRPGGGLGEQQIAYAREVLTKSDAKWTLLFFHRPLWLYGDKAGYEQVEELLRGRQYAVFTGHHHHYLKAERNGMPHYVLATCGGGTELRGAEFGEFDHVTWVTMSPEGPAVVNLALKGIVRDDVVNERIYDATQTLRRGNWLSVLPVLAPSEKVESVAMVLRLNNPAGIPLTVSGNLKPHDLGTFDPKRIDITVAAKGTVEVPVTLLANSTTTVHALNEAGLQVELTGSFAIDGKAISLPTKAAIEVDTNRMLKASDAPVTIDGDLRDWTDNEFTLVTRPMTIDEDWDWSGPNDGRFAFALRRTDGQVFVAVRTWDDKVLTAPSAEMRQDRIQIAVETPGKSQSLEAVATSATPSTAGSVSKEGLQAEFVFPIAKDGPGFRLQVAWVDHDRPENTKPSVLRWRNPNVREFGLFHSPEK